MPKDIYSVCTVTFKQCLPLIVIQLKGKHFRKPHCRNGVVDTFGPNASLYGQFLKYLEQLLEGDTFLQGSSFDKSACLVFSTETCQVHTHGESTK